MLAPMKFAIICCIYYLSWDAITFAAGSQLSVSHFGDVTVSNDGKKWKCDRIYCPTGTYRCNVQKYNSPTNPGIVIRKNFCYSEHNTILNQHTSETPIKPHQTISVSVDSYRNGISSVGSYRSQQQSGNSHGTSFRTHQSSNHFESKFEESVNKVNRQALKQSFSHYLSNMMKSFGGFGRSHG